MAETKVGRDYVRFFTSTMIKNGYKASEVYQLLANAWGKNNIPSDRQIRNIAVKSTGDLVKIKRVEGSGRRKSTRNEENIHLVDDLIRADRRLSLRKLEHQTNIPKTCIEEILKKDLHLKSVCAKWVPHNLADGHKTARIESCENLIQVLGRRNARRNIYVCDEKWIYLRSVPNNTCVSAWLPNDGSGHVPTLARRSQSDRKILVIFLCNFTGNAYYEFLEEGVSVNSDRYIQFLRNSIAHLSLNNVQLHNILWQHDNARPHTSKMTNAFIQQRGLTLLRQSPYSPDLNLMDRYIFRNLESNRRGQDFDSVNEVKQYVYEFKDSLTEGKLVKELHSLVQHCRDVIAAGGDYI